MSMKRKPAKRLYNRDAQLTKVGQLLDQRLQRRFKRFVDELHGEGYDHSDLERLLMWQMKWLSTWARITRLPTAGTIYED